jgi:NADH-quinone oxidoreductase subunit J
MTSRPRPIDLNRSLVPGLIAVALFAIMTLVFLTANGTAPFESAFETDGFADVSVVAGIGYALIGAAESAGSEVLYRSTENFLVALILVAVLLDAALDGALMLAKRDEGGDG